MQSSVVDARDFGKYLCISRSFGAFRAIANSVRRPFGAFLTFVNPSQALLNKRRQMNLSMADDLDQILLSFRG
ncbi:hypothetical protein XH99_10760 [Bradyrhizobium nanningense]|uniref:Uncharacterized protein n=1 Tax=Bradyrhizobium nanningense TaxID=1325118 RepID=A0A4Q0S857_9BRAD|nr:hypothetical protein XH84_20865 [Bradyrhizobium nanningense]RXH31416.1 hypothetical protein XH99_10760 [Bradyrhizobium nanningense]